MDAKALAERLAKNAAAACDWLLPQGRKEGREWVFDPGQGKIKVVLEGTKAGIWSHWGGDGAGDLLDLIVKVGRAQNIGEAIGEAKRWLGIEDPKFTGPKKRVFKAVDRPEGMVPVTKIPELLDYWRGERGIPVEILDRYRVASVPAYHGVKEDGRKTIWPGPWTVFPALRPVKEGRFKIGTRGFDLYGLKYRHKDRGDKGKQQTLQAKGSMPMLWGYHALPENVRWCVVFEGEPDCLTGAFCGLPALSAPLGGGTGDKQQWIDNDWELLEQFDLIILCFDMDAEGQAAVAEVAPRLGLHRTRVARLPHKDINECWAKHGMPPEELRRLIVEESSYIEPEELRAASSFVEQVIEEFYPPSVERAGRLLCFPRLREKFRVRYQETTILTGINGHGKSLLLNQILLHMMDEGERTCIASLEIPARKNLHRMTQTAAQHRRPKESYIRALHDWYDGKLWIYNVVGVVGIDRILEVFLYARRRFGVRVFVIDSLMKLGIPIDDLNAQDALVGRLEAFAQGEDCHVFLVAHSTKQKDERVPVGRQSIKGSGGITDQTCNTMSVWRNTLKETALDQLDQDKLKTEAEKLAIKDKWYHKPDAILIVDKQRYGEGWVGRIPLWFDGKEACFRDEQAGKTPILKTTPAMADHGGVI